MNENKSTSSKVEFVYSFFRKKHWLEKSFRICLTFRDEVVLWLCKVFGNNVQSSQGTAWVVIFIAFAFETRAEPQTLWNYSAHNLWHNLPPEFPKSTKESPTPLIHNGDHWFKLWFHTGYSFWDRLRIFLHKFTCIVLPVHKLNKLGKFW